MPIVAGAPKTGNDRHSRRALLAAALGAGLSGLPSFARASDLTVADISVLNSPAIQLRSFAQVFLTAIARSGNRMVAVGEHGVIVYSDDGGVSWTQADVPVDLTLTCVAFATPLIGWAGGHYGVILNTQDGGKSWKMQLNGILVNQLALATAQTAQSGPSPALEFALKRATMFETNGPDKPFLTILPFNPRKIMAFGAYRMVVLSEDGGKTWQDWTLHVYDKLSHDLYDVAAIGSGIYLACETGLVFRSTDGGDTFPQMTPPVDATLFGVIGARDDSVTVYGVAGNCCRSADGGASWNAINLDTQDDLVAARALPSGALLIARITGGLFISRDNGTSYAAVPDFPRLSVSDFEFAPDGALIVVGATGPARLNLEGVF